MKTLLVLTLLVFIIFFVFGQLPQTFFQQDEWYGQGLVYANGINSAFNGVSRPIDLLVAKGRIVSGLIYFFFVNYFPIQNSQMAFFAISLHIVATFFVYLLIRRFIHNIFFSFLGALFFAVNSVSHGSITWPVVAPSVVGSTMLILISVIFFLKYLKDSKMQWLVFSGLAIYISLWFKETGLYMFLFLPVSALVFKRFSIMSFLKKFWIFVLPFLAIVTYRVTELKLRTTTSNLYITGTSEDFYLTILFRSFFYPLTSFSLMFVPGDNLLTFARTILSTIYPFFARLDNNVLIAQTIVLDLLAIFLTFTLLTVIYFFYKFEKLDIKKNVVFWLIFSFMSFLPYILLSKDLSYLESRYYYLSVVGGAFLLSWLLKCSKDFLGNKVFVLVILPISLFYLFLHATAVKDIITEQVAISGVRQNFITDIKTLVPTLSNHKNIFYISSDQNYWVDGNKIPFQQGSGYTLMVLYFDSGKIPKEFLKPQGNTGEGFLFGIGSQGYIERDVYGFGYFWDMEELEKTIKVYNLPPESIISLHYDSDAKKLIKK